MGGVGGKHAEVASPWAAGFFVWLGIFGLWFGLRY